MAEDAAESGGLKRPPIVFSGHCFPAVPNSHQILINQLVIKQKRTHNVPQLGGTLKNAFMVPVNANV